MNKIFQADDFFGLFFVLLVSMAYLWQLAGRTRQQDNKADEKGPLGDSAITPDS
jgi:hypothetical protein